MIENNEKLIDMLAGGILYSQSAKDKLAQQAEKAAINAAKDEEF